MVNECTTAWQPSPPAKERTRLALTHESQIFAVGRTSGSITQRQRAQPELQALPGGGRVRKQVTFSSLTSPHPAAGFSSCLRIKKTKVKLCCSTSTSRLVSEPISNIIARNAVLIKTLNLCVRSGMYPGSDYSCHVYQTAQIKLCHNDLGGLFKYKPIILFCIYNHRIISRTLNEFWSLKSKGK